MRTPRALPPAESGETDGLAWLRFAPAGRPTGGVVVLHGADSVKENHADFARACAAGGLAALVFDARGHGASGGALDGRAIDDVTRMAAVLRARGEVTAIGLRGSSMGGYLALVAAAAADARGVVAICAASAAGLRTALRAGRFAFAADLPTLLALAEANDETAAIRALDARRIPVLLQHAEGDEVVPVELSRALAAAAPGATLAIAPGGDHRSLQHAPAAQSAAVAFLAGALGAGACPTGSSSGSARPR